MKNFFLSTTFNNFLDFSFFTSFATFIQMLASTFLFLFLRFKPKNANPFPTPPGPSTWPFLGNLPEFVRNKPRFRWILGVMNDMSIDIACFHICNVDIISVSCPKIAREFLKAQDSTFASRPLTMASEHSSHGFLTIAVIPSGDQWKKMRRVVASEVLSQRRFQWLQKKREEEADNLIRYIHDQSMSFDGKKGTVVNVRVAARAYCGNVIRKIIFNKRYFGKGRSDGGPGIEEEEYVEALFNVLSLIFALCISDYLPSLRWLDLDGHEKKLKEAISVVNKYHDPIIDERIQQWRGGKDVFYMKKEPEDLLDVFISLKDESGEPLLSIEEIKAQVAELNYASVDNPSNALEWALAEMINKPEILQKATNEIDMVVGKERLVQESDLPKLIYVSACAKEAFRLHPVAPFNLPHVSNKDTTVAGYFIRKGSHVLLSRVGLGRNPKVWHDPLVFNPDRHLSYNKSPDLVDLNDPDLKLLSFSTGRRGCMGVQLGTAMTMMLFARLLQGFNWTAPPGVSKINLSESRNDIFMASPLLVQAMPRLPTHIYPKDY